MKKRTFDLVVDGDTIILTEPDAKFRAIYSKQYWRRGLDLRERSTTADFDLLAEAWNSANDKARQLGGLV